MQAESRKKFFSCYTTYINKPLNTDCQNVYFSLKYIRYIHIFRYTVSNNVRNVGNVAIKKLYSEHGIKTEL